MRWLTCNICNAEEDVYRDEINYKNIVKIYECSFCFEDYCGDWRCWIL